MNADRQHEGKTRCCKLIIKLLLYTCVYGESKASHQVLLSTIFAFLIRTVQLKISAYHDPRRSDLAVSAKLLKRCCNGVAN